MDFSLSEEQQAFAAVARAFAADEMEPFAREWDEKSHFPRETLQKAAALGFGGVYVTEEVGGSGLTRLDAAVIFEELARGCVSTTAFLTIHNMACAMIDRYGSEHLRKTYLPSLCAMERIASYCLTEPSAGSDAAALKTKARRDGEDYVLDGAKAFISGGGASDVYVVMARSGGEGPKGISCFLVEKGTKGLSFGAQEKKMGWKTQPTAMVMFDDCRIPAANRIGDEGQGFAIAMQGLDSGRLNISACSLGGAQYAYERTLQYMKERKQFGSALSEFQALRFRMADLATSLEVSRLMLHRAALAVTTKEPGATRRSAMAKKFVTDSCFDVANQCLQLHGGYGYLTDYPLERIVRDLRVHQILEGTNEVMRLIIAREEFSA